jgi:hypothetical protein
MSLPAFAQNMDVASMPGNVRFSLFRTAIEILQQAFDMQRALGTAPSPMKPETVNRMRRLASRI